MIKSRASRSLKGELPMPTESAPRAQKRTFALHDSLIQALDQMVTSGVAPTKNAVVERAIMELFSAFLQRRKAADWKVAASNPDFLKDIDLVAAPPQGKRSKQPAGAAR